MRIIAGIHRGRVLGSPRDLSVRPTTDRAKQTIFDILSNRMLFEGMQVLDLFAGTGSLGLEAISRGVSTVTFVDNSRESLAVLKKNVAALHCEDQCTMYQADVFWYLRNTQAKYDLVFADPPYKLEKIGTIPRSLSESGVLKPRAFVVMEHSRESAVDLDEQYYDILRKPFGQTTVLILQNKN
ncbi:MAG TPA: 16S rRNA (guanine(966)-N(2))-methyltransferase RsmD [Bacteroidota bacterium]